jgi:hypothetical protein
MAFISLGRCSLCPLRVGEPSARTTQDTTGSFSAWGVTLLPLWPRQWPSGWSCVAPCGRLWPRRVKRPVRLGGAMHRILPQG